MKVKSIHLPRSPNVFIDTHEACTKAIVSWCRERKHQPLGMIIDPNVASSELGSYLLSKLREVICHVAVIDDHEPSVDSVERIVTQIKEAGASRSLLAVGGGTAIDTGKLVALRIASNQWHLPNDFTRGLSQDVKTIPLAACPTTIGPGAEVSPAAIYSSESVKICIVDDILLPEVVYASTALASSLPTDLRFCMLCDAIAHSIEGLCSRNICKYAEVFHSHAICMILSVVPELEKNWDEEALRTAYQASLLSTYGTRVTGVNIIHGIASIIALQTGLRHCQAVSVALCAVVATLKDRSAVLEALRPCGYAPQEIWYKLDHLLTLSRTPPCRLQEKGLIAEQSRKLWRAQQERLSETTIKQFSLNFSDVITAVNSFC